VTATTGIEAASIYPSLLGLRAIMSAVATAYSALASVKRVGDAELLVARFEIRHARADFFNDAGQIRTERQRQRLIHLACTGANPRIPRPDA
jgi:hypothetical protein